MAQVEKILGGKSQGKALPPLHGAKYKYLGRIQEISIALMSTIGV
jgi:hypothetical protein